MNEVSKINVQDFKNLLDKIGWNPENFFSSYAKNIILDNWENIVGEGYSKYTYPLDVKNNKLVILVAHDVYRMELEFKKNLIFQKIHEIFNKGIITQLGFKIGTITQNHKKKYFTKQKNLIENSKLYYLIPQTENEITRQKLKELIDSFPNT